MSVIIGFVFYLRVLSIKRIVLTWKIEKKKQPVWFLHIIIE